MTTKIYVEQLSMNGRIAYVKNPDLAQYNLLRLNHVGLGRPYLFHAGRFIIGVLGVVSYKMQIVLFRVSPRESLRSEIDYLGYADSTTAVVAKLEKHILENFTALESEVELVLGKPDHLQIDQQHIVKLPQVFSASRMLRNWHHT